MSKNEINVKDRLEEFGWRSNPFSFRIYPDLLVGYEEEVNSVLEAIDSNKKFSVILGETGAGKTNILRWIHNKYSDKYEVYYLPKMPSTEDELLQYLKNEILKPNIFSRYLKNYSLYNIYGNINQKINSKCVFFIDEGHETPLEILRWLRTALDHIDNLVVVAAGLPSFEDTLKEDVRTLYSRATDVLELTSLDKNDTFNLVKKRIRKVGGNGLEPFTQNAILEVYRSTEGFPREVLRACDKVLSFAIREGRSIIDREDVIDIFEGEETERSYSEDQSQADVNLTEKQRKIIEVLLEKDRASSSDIAEKIGIDNYRSRSHAIRSVNNILKRLMDDEIISRERRGRSYEYYVNEGYEEILSED